MEKEELDYMKLPVWVRVLIRVASTGVTILAAIGACLLLKEIFLFFSV